MSGREIQHIPLDEEDKDFLIRVYKRRRKFLITLSLAFVVAGFEGAEAWVSRGHVLFKKPVLMAGIELSGWAASWAATFMSNCAISAAIVIAMYFKSVRKLRKDIAGGVKEQVPYTIIRKQSFSLTDKYYVWLDSAENTNHEVSGEEYYNCTEGDIIYIYRTPHAQMVFERNGRFEII